MASLSTKIYQQALSKKTIDILKASAPALSAHGDALAARFYDILFTKHPEQRKIFNMSHQRQKDGAASSQVIHVISYLCSFTKLSQSYVFYVVYFINIGLMFRIIGLSKRPYRAHFLDMLLIAIILELLANQLAVLQKNTSV